VLEVVPPETDPVVAVAVAVTVTDALPLEVGVTETGTLELFVVNQLPGVTCPETIVLPLGKLADEFVPDAVNVIV
jgi:hypothetical protein